MQENTESEKPEDSEIPENTEDTEEKTSENEPSETSDTDSQFEEQEGEVLPLENKKNRGCGFFIFILLLLTGGSGYLYYTDQIPPQIKEWIDPLLKPVEQSLGRIKPATATKPAKKWVSEVEEKIPAPTIRKEVPVVEEEPTIEIAPPAFNEEHVSGSESQPSPATEEVKSNYPAEISGNSTFVESESEILAEDPKPETFFEKSEEVEENKDEETMPAPVVKVAPQPAPQIEEKQFSEEPSQPKERDKAVQAYLDFVESTLEKIGALIKSGFTRGKDYLKKFLA